MIVDSPLILFLMVAVSMAKMQARLSSGMLIFYQFSFSYVFHGEIIFFEAAQCSVRFSVQGRKDTGRGKASHSF